MTSTPDVAARVLELLDAATLCYLRRDMPGMIMRLCKAVRMKGSRISSLKAYQDLTQQWRFLDYLNNSLEARAIIRAHQLPEWE